MDRMHVVGFHRGTVDNFMTPANSYPWERGEKLTPTFVSRMPGIWVWRLLIVSWARCFWASVVPGFHRKKKVWMTMRLL